MVCRAIVLKTLEIDIWVICVVLVLTTDADHVLVAVTDPCCSTDVNDDDA